MNNLTNRLMRFILIYISCIPILVILGFLHEHLAYAFLFFSSAFFGFGIVYETWKDSRPLKDIRYPAPKETPHLRTLELLTDTVKKAISGRDRYYTSVINHLRQIFLKRVRLGMARSDVEKLVEKPEKLHALVDDAELLKLLFSEETERKEERSELLNKILDKLEDL